MRFFNHPLAKLYFYLAVLLSVPALYADVNVSEELLRQLSHERTWLKLLYYDETTQQSDVVSNDYFLSNQGKTDPLEELKATLKGYDQPFLDDPNDHPTCRFPARYLWLSQKLDLKEYRPLDPRCDHLRKSLDATPIDSISLMFVSGYLGNPASSFGHSFLKLNSQNDTSSDLFDLSVSYGADVPENENIFAYMYKGLFGKYVAAFKDKYFFSQDLVYSNNEFRDIWEYELNLPKEKVLFLQLHLWEILQKKFQYRFLNKNCGYEVSKLLEVVLDQDIAQSATLWFAPIETFHALADLDASEPIIRQRIYHPSEQKKVFKRYQELTPTEQEVAVYLIRNGMEDPQNLYQPLNDAEKTDIINFAITYFNYLLVKDRGNREYEQQKKKALIERFALPVQRENELTFGGAKAPDYNDRPSVLSLSFTTSEKAQDYPSIGFTPYAIRSTGRNNLDGDELSVLDTEVGLLPERPFLKKLDLIRIRQFDRYAIPLNDETRVSWQLKMAMESVDIDQNRYDAFMTGGVGKTWVLSDQVLTYALFNASVHSNRQQLALSPEIGTRLDFGDLKSVASFEYGYDLHRKRSLHSHTVTSNLKIGKNRAWYVQYHNSSSLPAQLTTGIQFFF